MTYLANSPFIFLLSIWPTISPLKQTLPTISTPSPHTKTKKQKNQNFMIHLSWSLGMQVVVILCMA